MTHLSLLLARPAALPALAAALLLTACSGRESTGIRAVGILPFENLAASDLDWMGRGFGESLRLQLAGTPRTQPVALGALRDAPGSGAGLVVHGYFSVQGGRLDVRADIEDLSTHRMTNRIAVSGPVSGGMLPLSREIALKIAADARTLPTRSETALRAYVEALESADAPAGNQAFGQAVAADPSFGAAWADWAQALIARGDRTAAAQALASARANVSRFQNLERARLAVVAAALTGDREGQRRALGALALTMPADTGVLRQLAALDTAGHRYLDAAAWYERIAQRQPEDAAVFNLLGYAYAWGGRSEKAIQALERYRALAPKEANPIDSLGDVQYSFGHFAEAAKLYEESDAKDRAFLGGGSLYKAAWARLMQGDRKTADATFARFIEARQAAQDPIVPYRRAQWEYLTGRRKEALARLEQIAQSPQSPLASLACAQLAIWSLEAGDRAGALRYAQRSPAPGGLTAIAAFLAQPPASAQEWKARGERLLPQPGQAGLRRLAVAYALLLSKDFGAAVAPLGEAYAASVPSSPDWPAVLLAWALIESGKFDRIPELLGPNPVPVATGDRPFISLEFPRLFFLRAVAAEKQNRRDEARANYQRYLDLAGAAPDFFGERERATKALAHP